MLKPNACCARRVALTMMLATAMLSASCQAQLEVWATTDGVRVNPVTGKYLEDRTDIHKDYPSGDYQTTNPVWDAATGKVAIKSARNEFVAFQVVVSRGASAWPAKGVRVSLDSLTGPGGAKISGKHVALFKAWSMNVLKKSTGYRHTSLGPGWYPDALRPAPAGKALTFNIPDRLNKIGKTQRNQTVWVDIYVPRDRKAAPPGKYTGELVVSHGKKQKRIAVELEVWDFALPEEIHCKGDIWNSSLRWMNRALELKYYHMMRRHRMLPGVCYYQPKIRVKGAEVSIDWTNYDKRIMRYLDGTAYTAKQGYWGPGVGLPIDHIILPLSDRGWPPTKGGIGSKNFDEIWIETARQVKEHFDADPRRRKVGKVVFLGGLDESYSEQAYKRMRYYCDLIRKGVGGKDWFRYRIDGGYPWKAMEGLKNHVDLWVCHTIGFDKKKMAHFRKQGVEPWFYGPMIYERSGNANCGSNTFTDLDLLTCRGVGWVAWKYQSGYCQWEFDAYYHAPRRGPRKRKDGDRNWWEAINVTYGRGGRQQYNGSGLLIYRGAKELSGSTDPVASIRLKAHRRGFQDYEYFWLLRQAGMAAKADELVNSVIHREPFGRAAVKQTEIWKNNPEAWDEVRTKIGEMLSAAAGGK